MYDLRHLDPIHREALDNCTELLQCFMERQNDLRKQLKDAWHRKDYHQTSGELQSEKSSNANIVKYIQFVRYHLQGCDKKQVAIKTNHEITEWNLRAEYGGPRLHDYAIEKLNPSRDRLYHVQFQYGGFQDYYTITYRNLVLTILDKVIPPRESNGIFGLMDENPNKAYGSITLEAAVNNIMSWLEQ